MSEGGWIGRGDDPRGNRSVEEVGVERPEHIRVVIYPMSNITHPIAKSNTKIYTQRYGVPKYCRHRHSLVFNCLTGVTNTLYVLGATAAHGAIPTSIKLAVNWCQSIFHVLVDSGCVKFI